MWKRSFLKKIASLRSGVFVGCPSQGLINNWLLKEYCTLFISGTVKVWDEGIEKNLQRKLMNAPCLQYKDVNWIEVRPNFHRRNLSFCLGLHNCRPFCCTFFQYNLQRASPSNTLPWFIYWESTRLTPPHLIAQSVYFSLFSSSW